MIPILKDLWAVRAPLAILAVVLAAGTAGVGYTGSKLDHARAVLQNQRSALEHAQYRYRKSGEEQQIIVRYLSEYRRLEQEGFIGPERRIDWIDALRAADRELRMFGVTYQIGAQQPYPGTDGLDAGPLRLWQSPMRLTFGLLHEGDLMHFFNALDRLHAGVFVLEGCTVARMEGASPGYRPHLQADCQLNWITLGPGGERQAGLTGSRP